MRRSPLVARLSLALVILISAVAPMQAAESDPVAVQVAPHLAPAAPRADYTAYLPALMHVGKPQPKPPSTDLIQRALDEGRLDANTALLYQVYAAFSDSSLPATYRGDDTMVEDSPVMAAVAERYNSLPAALQAELAPFRLPPNVPGSWYATRQAAAAKAAAGDWQVVNTANGKARVWYSSIYQGEAQQAAAVAAAIDAKIWPGLRDLMGREPLSDAGAPNDGSDGRLDIYLVRDMADMGQAATTRGLTIPNVGCKATSAWILINSGRGVGSATQAGMLQTVTHEMMHAWQFSYNLAETCTSYNWLAEATAKWAEDYIYPQAQSEQPYAPQYLKTVYWPLEQWSGLRAYGAYLFFFHATRSQEKPSIVRSVWAYSQSYNSLKATDLAAGPLNTVWPDFALNNWNSYPLDSYKQWDGLTARAEPFGGEMAVKLDGGTDMAYTLPSVLEHLSIHYRHFKFSDPGVRSVTFFNGLTYKLGKVKSGDGSEFYNSESLPYELTKGAKVQALIKIEGQPWQVEDWTNVRSKFYCRDERAGRLEDLVLIQSYSEHENTSYKMQPADLDPTLYVSNIGCWRYQGTVTWQGSRTTPSANSSESATVTNIIWERDSSMFGANQSPMGFKVKQGNLSFTSSHSATACTRQASANFALNPQDSTMLIIQRWATSGDEWRAYDAAANSTGDLVEHSVCPDPEDSTGPFGAWLETNEGVQVRADGTLYGTGSGYGWGDSDMDRTWTWSFTPIREP